MGAGVSSWRLARAVSTAGQLGVVAGTALDLILARRLQLGDPGGQMRRALRELPFPEVAQRILERYFVPGGKSEDATFRAKPMPAIKLSTHLEELIVAANFVEVFLAKEGHDRPVGINYLEKIQLPTLPSLFGAILAGVDYVLMGAGIPTTIPEVLDRLVRGQAVELAIDVSGPAADDRVMSRFDPGPYLVASTRQLVRPRFLAIISTQSIATVLLRRARGEVDGFVIEGPTAGGHNAPPRGQLTLSETGEPVYGRRDVADLAVLRRIGRPFWLAGSYAHPQGVALALAQGAAGVQVGTAFAYCKESGLEPRLRRRVLEMSRAGQVSVFTDPVASPTGFPFKVVGVEGTLSGETAYRARRRVCDLGYLRQAFRTSDGRVGWRCPAEPVADYVRKGGRAEETVGRKCVCNGLLASIGLAQSLNDASYELPLLTSGDDAREVARFLQDGETEYSARDVIRSLLPGKAALNQGSL